VRSLLFALLALLAIESSFHWFVSRTSAQGPDEIPFRQQAIDWGYVPYDGETKMENGLWGECPKERQFAKGGEAVIADIKGPGVITMIHFALGGVALSTNRDTIIRIYWDGEETPSVECPLPDFFCDPNGAIERVDSVLVNKLRGWNAYFPMPFAKSARVELTYDNPRYASANPSPGAVPAYSYVIYRKLESLPADAQYFHAQWRKQALLFGKNDYEVIQASGLGQLIGWNLTLRALAGALPPVDENEKVFVDGSSEPSGEWQGLEDPFGFSWNFPPQANSFPYAGYHPFFGGYAAYRFFLNDRIPFRKSLRMTLVATGIEKEYSKLGSELEFTSVAYWYQKEPHQPFQPMLSARDRMPFEPAPSPEKLAADRKHLEAGESLVLKCGGASSEIEILKPGWAASHGYVTHPGFVTVPQCASEIEFLKPGWDFRLVEAQPINDSIARIEGWPSGSWRSIGGLLEAQLLCPKRTSGTLKLFLLDGDKAGRKENVTVAGRLIGEYANLEKGKWVEAPISAADSAEGVIPITIKQNAGPDAALSEIVFVESKSAGRPPR
jgi:hypothetical protein